MKRKAIVITLSFLCIVTITTICVYFGYGTTLINPNSEKSLNKHLGVSNNSIITILSQTKYNEYLGILYTDSNDENNDIIHFSYLRESKIIKNHYKLYGGKNGNSTINSAKISREDDYTYDSPIYFIYGRNVKDNLCTVFECNENGYLTHRIEEIFISDSPFIITKNYRLSNESDIFVFEGKVTEKDVSEMMEENN